MDFTDRFLAIINPGTFNLHDEQTHLEIIDAIAARDEIKAMTLVRAHLLEIRDKMIAQEQDYLARSTQEH